MRPFEGSPGERVIRALDHAFFEAGVMIRPAGDTIELTPPLIVSENDIGEIIDKVGRVDQSGGLSDLSRRPLWRIVQRGSR